MKVKILKSGKYSLDGVNIVEYIKDEIVDIPEASAKMFAKGGLVVFIQDDIENTIIIETPKQPVLETKPIDLSDLEYKELKEQAEQAGFVKEGKGRASKEELINFLNEVEND